MTPERWVFAAATVALVLALARGMPVPGRRTMTHPAVVGAAALFLVSLMARALFVEPTLIHADVAAPLLVDCVLDFPLPCTNRGASYGQYGFWLTGGLAYLLGGDLSAVFASMQVIAAANVLLLAVLAYRYSGSPYGALLAVAAIGTNPIFMRVAASEDMHNLGLFLGLLAFVAIDVFAETRRTLALVAAAIALCLMIHTRQTFHVFAPCAFLLGLARGGRGILRNAAFWGGALIVLTALLSRVIASDSENLTQQMIAIVSQPVLLPNMLRYHALFDIARFGLLPLLTIAAIVWACAAGGMARAVAIVFGLNFLLTYPCGMPSPGVELAQRLATHALGMLLFALAGATVVERQVPSAWRFSTALATAVALLSLPPFFPGWRMLGVQTPIHREYLAVAAAATELPREFTQIVLPYSDSNSYGGSRYAGLLARMGKNAHTTLIDDVGELARPWLFLENIECWTYSFYELVGIEKEAAKNHRFEFRWDRVLFGRQPSPVRPPAEAREQCEPFLRRGKPIGARRVITDPEDDPPFLFYGSRTVPIQFYELPEDMTPYMRGSSSAS
jgi:hypothetical protein